MNVEELSRIISQQGTVWAECGQRVSYFFDVVISSCSASQGVVLYHDETTDSSPFQWNFPLAEIGHLQIYGHDAASAWEIFLHERNEVN